MTWTLGPWPPSFQLEPVSEADAERRVVGLGELQYFLRRQLGDPVAMSALRRAFAAHAGGDLSRCDDHELIRRIGTRLDASNLRLTYLVVARGGFGGGRRRRPPSIPNEAITPDPAPDTSAWIDVQLINDKGEAVSGVRYVITAPDGNKHQGTTDIHGFAKLRGLPEGACTVSFPDLDETSVKPA